MSKVFKSSSFARTFKGTRQEAIVEACRYFVQVFDAFGEDDAKRYTWRADDGSGFTIACTPRKHLGQSTKIECVSKWNAAREPATIRHTIPSEQFRCPSCRAGQWCHLFNKKFALKSKKLKPE